MAAEDTSFQSLVYKLGPVVVVGIFWYFRKPLKEKYYAWQVNKISNKFEKELSEYKTRMFQCVRDYHERVNRNLAILEVGSGSATNLKFFPSNTKLVCLDPNPQFAGYLQKNLKKHDVSAELVQGFAENMPFDEGKFDVVVTTFVLCSVADVKKSLAEIMRVLKPGGMFVFMENVGHHHHHHHNTGWLSTVQMFIHQLMHRIFGGGGADALKHVREDIEATGFSRVDITTFEPKNLPSWSRQLIMGSATK